MKQRFVILIITLLIISCTQPEKQVEVTRYTCPMHPNVVQDGPGKCPVCGMDLVVQGPQHQAETSNDLMLSDSQIKLANITTGIVSKGTIGQTTVVNGRLKENQDKAQVISARAAGRIDKLYFKETGRVTKKGEPLYELYSESLSTLQQEFLLAKEQFETLGSKYKSFYDASRKKLILYGLTNEQINKLDDERKANNRITFLAPVSGTISTLNVTEGQYVSEGDQLFKLEDFSTLWLEMELYPGELNLVKVGDKVRAHISGLDNQSVQVTIDFLNPEYRNNTQLVIVRGTLTNPGNNLKPGMQAQVYFTHSGKSALTVPVDAVIRDGHGTHVYVQRGNNTFRPQMVRTGLEDFDRVEISEGLTEGDTVAITGAYLLYSEIVLKKGADPMEGHHH